MSRRKRICAASFVFLILLINLVFVSSVQVEASSFGEAGKNPPSRCSTGFSFGECGAQPMSTIFYCDGYTTESTYAYSQRISAPCTLDNYQTVLDALCASVMVGGIKDVRTDEQKLTGCCPSKCLHRDHAHQTISVAVVRRVPPLLMFL